MTAVTVEAPAKINLVLDVLAKRPDGFHDIESLMIGVGLFDRLVFEEHDGDGVILSSSDTVLPVGNSNLVCVAANRLADRLGRSASCRIRLDKNIPVGGGMGGGSSDAAAALIGLNELWGAGLNREELSEIGSTIGSDVPFFFDGSSAIVSGKGERVRPAKLTWKGWVVLVMAGMEVSTASVYANCVPSAEPRSPSIEELLEVETAGELGAGLRNDLEKVVFADTPAVARLHKALVELGAKHVRVTGAGSVLFALYDDQMEATEMVHRIRAEEIADSVTLVEAPL